MATADVWEREAQRRNIQTDPASAWDAEARRRAQRTNPDGSISTELSITIPDPRVPGGWMNVPSMFEGKEMSEGEALRRIQNAGYKDPETGRPIGTFGSIEEATKEAKARSDALSHGAIRKDIDRGLSFHDMPGGPIPDSPIVRDIARAPLGGGRDMAVGVAALVPDLAAAAGFDWAQGVGDEIRKAVPTIPTETTAGGLLQTLVQFGIPAATSAKLVGNALKGAPTAVRYISQVLTAGGSDVVASRGDEPTLFNKPQEGLQTRLQTGLEGTLMQPVGDVLSMGLRSAAAIRGMKKTAEKAAARTLQESASDPQRFLRELEAEPTDVIRPTTEQITSDMGIDALATNMRGSSDLTISGPFRAVDEENLRAIGAKIDEVAQRYGPPIDQEQLSREGRRPVVEAETALAGAENIQKEATDELENFIGNLKDVGDRVVGASETIDRNVRESLDKVTREKNAKFAAIDPNREVVIEKDNLRKAFKEMLTPNGPLDQTPQDVINAAGTLLQKIQTVLRKPKVRIDPETGAREIIEPEIPLTYGDLAGMRPGLSAAIAQARKNDQGHVVVALSKLKRVLDVETEALAEKVPAAKEALRYYADEYAPLFREQAGDAYRKAVRSGRAIAPSKVGKVFLHNNPGAKEAAEQLKGIIFRTQDPAAAEQAVRDFIIGDIATNLSREGGRTNLRLMQRRMANPQFKAVLEKYPAVRDELKRYVSQLQGRTKRLKGIGEEIAERQANLRQAESDWKLNPVKAFVDNDPILAVGNAINSKNAAKSMKELVRLAKRDKTGKSMEGLKTAVSEWVHQTTRSSSREIGGRLAVVQNKVKDLLRNPNKRAALKEIYTIPEIKTLDKVHDALEIMERSTGVGTISPTQFTNQTKNAMRVVMAGYFGIVKGRAVFFISDQVMKRLGVDPSKMATEVLTEAMVNPQFAKKMMKRYTGDTPTQKIIKLYESVEPAVINVLNNALARYKDENTP